VAKSSKAAADLKATPSNPLGVAYFEAGAAGRAATTLEHNDQFWGQHVLRAIQFQPDAVPPQVQ
jgi:hypothetical protein